MSAIVQSKCAADYSGNFDRSRRIAWRLMRYRGDDSSDMAAIIQLRSDDDGARSIFRTFFRAPRVLMTP
jgi:hypothetical protein